MRPALRDLRLVPAALSAWLSAGLLVGPMDASPAAAVAAAACWGIAGACCVAAVLLGLRRRPGVGTTLGRRAASIAAVLPSLAIAAVAAAWPATTIAVGGRPSFESMPEWAMAAEPLRAGFRELVAAMPGDGGQLLPGLAIGDDSMVGPALLDAMRITSLTHLTAVSGANCALVVGAVMVLGALAGVPRGLRIVLALTALSAFVILVTPQPSVVRAAVMAAFALGGLAAARPMRGLPLLCVAIAGILGAVPAAAIELGFLLSALATAGLLLLSGPLGAIAATVLPARLATALAVPVAAQLAVQPAIALIEPALPTYGVIANLLAVPAAALATVLGMLACLIAPVLPELGLGLAWLGWLPSQWIASVATTFAGFPAARLPWPEGALGVALHIGMLLAGAVCAMAAGGRRLVAGLVILAAGAGYAGSLAGTAATSAIGRPERWSLAMCDVGQGDAAVVRSAGVIALVDAGPDPAALRHCLSTLGVTRIDLLVITHFDRDHVGGVEAIIGRVDTVLTGPADTASKAEILEPLEAAGARIVDGRLGDRGTLGGYHWRVLWPPARGAPEPGNDTSLVWRIDPGPTETGPSAVLLGDLGETAQARLLGRGLGGPAAVVKASHHGSADQHGPLYAALASGIALIGVGADNDYGHPTTELLGLLDELGAVTGRTDTDGLLLVAATSEGVPELWRSRAAAPPDVSGAK